MNIKKAILHRRSVRKFARKAIAKKDLLDIADVSRLYASGGNLQPLRFIIVKDAETVKKVHPLVKWAAYLPDWEPKEKEKPAAYIAVVADESVKSSEKSEYDAGAAMTTMMLAALDKGLGTCALGAINREELHELFALDENKKVMYLLALGYPAQSGKIFNMKADVKYFFDKKGNVHVPKRKTKDIVSVI